MNHTIPSEVYLAFLDRTIPIHWEYHAILMTLAMRVAQVSVSFTAVTRSPWARRCD